MPRKPIKPHPKPHRLTDKQRRFCQEYIKCLSLTEAARRAGYKDTKTIGASGFNVFKHPLVQAELKRLYESTGETAEVTVARVIGELKLIAFSDGSECFPRIQDGRITPPDVHSLPEAQRRNIAEVNISKQGVKVSRFDKVKALELLGKHLAMFTERAVVAGDPEAPLVIVQAKE